MLIEEVLGPQSPGPPFRQLCRLTADQSNKWKGGRQDTHGPGQTVWHRSAESARIFEELVQGPNSVTGVEVFVFADNAESQFHEFGCQERARQLEAAPGACCELFGY